MKTTIGRLIVATLAFALLCGFEVKADAKTGGNLPTPVRPAATLDPAFGVGGLLRLPNEGNPEEIHAALLADGGLFFREYSGYFTGPGFRLLSSDGGLGTSFGVTGTLIPPALRKDFRIEDFTLDPEGRLLFVGTTFPTSEQKSVEGLNGSKVEFAAANVGVARLLPNGQLDPTFGEGGLAETNFGLPPARDSEGHPYIAAPSVGGGGVAVDAHGGIVVTGSVAIGIGSTCIHDDFESVAASLPFVGRLTEKGVPDPNFSGDGVVGGRNQSETPLGTAQLDEPIIGPDGAITYRSTYTPCGNRAGVAQLTASGEVRMGLGHRGVVRGNFTALASNPDGSIIAVATLPQNAGELSKTRVVKISPNGRLDPSFGDNGDTIVTLGRFFTDELNSLAIDSQGRILLGGTLRTSKGRWALLVRLSPEGRQEMDFGPHGRVTTPVPDLARFGPSDLLVDPEGRVVTLHRYKSAAGAGLLIARYRVRD